MHIDEYYLLLYKGFTYTQLKVKTNQFDCSIKY